MQDNKISQLAHLYDDKIERTIPFYNILHEQSIDVVKTVQPNARRWLDAGCGTGLLVEKALIAFPDTEFVLLDPAELMLKISKDKLDKYDRKLEFILTETKLIDLPKESFDVITAILSHHYYHEEIKKKVTENCYKMLRKGGVYINIESIRPGTEKGLKIGLSRWSAIQLGNGKTEKEVVQHLGRYGKEFFPTKIENHFKLMSDAGFSTIELFWVSILQAGFYGIK